MTYRKGIPCLYTARFKNIIIGDSDGKLKPGDRLPSETQMQKAYKMSRVTVRNAMAELEVEGCIIKVQEKGSFVAQSDMLQGAKRVTSFTGNARMRESGLQQKVLEAGLRKVETEIDKAFFELDDDGKIMMVRRGENCGWSTDSAGGKIIFPPV